VSGVKPLLAALAGAVLLVAPAGAAIRAHALDPVFSPDGRTVAFVRSAGSSAAIMLADRDGRRVRTLVPRVFAQYLSWSPDGRSLAYSADGIWRVDLDDPTPQLLTRPSPDVWQPAWSPDGRAIAYSQFERCFRCTGIWVMGADGSEPHELVQDGRRPAWSPDGSKLALSLSGAGLVIGLDGRTILPGGGAYTTWSPRGVYVAYTGFGLYVANLETGARRRLTRFMGEKPAWSPDGTVIAGGYRTRVRLVRARDGKVTKVFRDSTSGGGAPSWSRDGLVAFVHAGLCGIDVARADGTGLRRLTRTC